MNAKGEIETILKTNMGNIVGIIKLQDVQRINNKMSKISPH